MSEQKCWHSDSMSGLKCGKCGEIVNGADKYSKPELKLKSEGYKKFCEEAVEIDDAIEGFIKQKYFNGNAIMPEQLGKICVALNAIKERFERFL